MYLFIQKSISKRYSLNLIPNLANVKISPHDLSPISELYVCIYQFDTNRKISEKTLVIRVPIFYISYGW